MKDKIGSSGPCVLDLIFSSRRDWKSGTPYYKQRAAKKSVIQFQFWFNSLAQKRATPDNIEGISRKISPSVTFNDCLHSLILSINYSTSPSYPGEKLPATFANECIFWFLSGKLSQDSKIVLIFLSPMVVKMKHISDYFGKCYEN